MKAIWCALAVMFLSAMAKGADGIYVKMNWDVPAILSNGGQFTAEKGDFYPFVNFDGSQTLMELKFGPFTFWTRKENAEILPEVETVEAAAKYRADVAKFRAFMVEQPRPANSGVPDMMPRRPAETRQEPLVTPPGAGRNEYDARADFSSTENPNGVWIYGWSGDLAGPLHAYGDMFEKQGGYNWTDNTILASGAPQVALYPLDAPLGNIPPHSMLMHPGPGNQFSHCVWKAPAAGVYIIRASFTALDSGRPHGYVLKNGILLSDSVLDFGKAWGSSFDAISVVAGDTIDAAVGVGPNNSYFDDETGFSLTITAKGSGAQPSAAGGDIAPAVVRDLDQALRMVVRREVAKALSRTR